MSAEGKVLFYELNEFNRELLKKASEQLNLKNIQKLLALHETTAETKDTYDSDYLEPWVQWVSMHTGTTSDQHQIKHLGDVTALKYPQIWEKLGQEGKTCGVWGVLNGSLGNTPNCKFFFPDPWTFSEQATPSNLNPLLDFPRYMAKNRSKMSLFKTLYFASRFMFRFIFSNALLEFFIELPRAIRMILKFPKSEFAGFCYAEYLLGILFLGYWKKHKPDFSILFVNSIAHLQHYYWNDFNYKDNEKLAYGLYFIDKLTGKIFDTIDLSNNTLVVANALSQMNTNHEEPWIAYRPKDHNEFFKAAGLNIKTIEALMSYDALAFCHNSEERDYVFTKLSEATINEKPLFLVEKYADEPTKIFYRLQFYSPVNKDTKLQINGNHLNFNDHFAKIIQRTGKHIQRSSIYSNDKSLPKRMWNHEIYQYFYAKMNNKTFETTFKTQ